MSFANEILEAIRDRYPAAAAAADSLADPEAQGVVSHPLLYNGATWDRQRSNSTALLLALAERTGGGAAAPIQVNYNWRYFAFSLRITALGGAGPWAGIRPRFRGYDALGQAMTIFDATALVNTVDEHLYMFGPGMAGAPTGNVRHREPVIFPRSWDVVIIHADAESYTYSLSVSMGV